MKVLEKITKFDESTLGKLLFPIWKSDKILGETGLIVGADGEIKLLAHPTQGCVEVKNIFGDVL